MRHRISVRRVALAMAAAGLLASGPDTRGAAQASRSFSQQIAELSEPPGYFDTDNLISNERSYLQVIPDLERRNVHGGAYLGVGPDQNFSYIAQTRPAVAFIVDIRRDNLLLHLLFKALFDQSRTRVEFAAQLFGRPIPADAEKWRRAAVNEIAAFIDDAPADGETIAALRSRLDRVIAGFGVPLSAGDRASIDRFHRRFMEAGTGLRFESTGRPPQSYYPTYRQLLLETDPLGRQRNYLASEESFQFVKSLQARDLVIPVVGNLSGPSALAAIGRAVGERHEVLSAFYTSNVEFYLQRDGTYLRFADNLARIPHTSRSVIIRAVFGRGGAGSSSMVQPVDELLSEFAVRR